MSATKVFCFVEHVITGCCIVIMLSHLLYLLAALTHAVDALLQQNDILTYVCNN